MSTTHKLKCWPQYFEMLYVKPFELRLDDRDYKVGDVLHLQEWEPTDQQYTGRECLRDVIYILPQGSPGLAPGYVVLGLGPWKSTRVGS